MPIMICADCGRPVADSFHNFEKVCECIPISEQKKRDKKKGWKIKYPKGQRRELACKKQKNLRFQKKNMLRFIIQ